MATSSLEDESAASGFYKIKVTHFIDPLNFSAQIGSDDSFSKFSKREENLAKHCEFEVSKGEWANLESLSVGALILVKSPTWDKWVRAKVISESDGQEVDVICIDYGSSELVGAESVVTIVPQMYSQPVAWAWRCQQTGIVPIAATWVSRALNRFSELVFCLVLDCQVVKMESNCVIVDILVEEESEIHSIADVMIADDLARKGETPTSPIATGGDMGVPDFNLKWLEKQRSLTPPPSEEDQFVDDIEIRFFKEGLDLQHKWVPSDMTIGVGKEYQPNVDEDVVSRIRKEIRQTHSDSTEDESAGDYTRKGQIEHPLSSPQRRPRSSDRLHADSLSPASKGVALDKSPITTRKGRGRGKKYSLEENFIGGDSSRDSSPFARSHFRSPMGSLNNIHKGNHEDSSVSGDETNFSRKSSSDNVATDGVKARLEMQSSKESSPECSVSSKKDSAAASKQHVPDQKKLKNEYEWQSSQLAHKVRKIMNGMTPENLACELEKLFTEVKKAGSILSHLPGPSEVYVLLDVVLQEAVFHPKQKMEIAINIIEAFHEYAQFSKAISVQLWKHQNDSVKLPASPRGVNKQREKAEAYCQLLAHLFICADNWSSDSDTINVCIIKTLDKWSVFNKQRHHQAPNPLLELYSDCLEWVLSIAGYLLDKRRPSEMQRIFSELEERALATGTQQSVKLKTQELILHRNNQWESLNSNEGTQPRANEVQAKKDQAHGAEYINRKDKRLKTGKQKDFDRESKPQRMSPVVKMEDAYTQTPEEIQNRMDAAVQTKKKKVPTATLR